MKNISLVFFIIIAISSFSFGDDQIALSNQKPAYYYIDAALDTSAKTLAGIEEIYFLNPTDKDLTKLSLHLYPNAFRDTSTTLARSREMIRKHIEGNPAYIDCDSILVDGQTPDSVIVDETLLHIYLSKALKPGGQTKVSLKFNLKVPYSTSRFGFDENGNYLLSHWHPILTGYQKGTEIVFQYHPDGEFFSNFADYQVRLEIPDSFKLVSTSSTIKPDSIEANTAIYNLHAENVIDFAFGCGPSWELELFNHDGVVINIFYLAEHKEKLEVFKKFITATLDYFAQKLYPYPYPNLSFVDFFPHAGGMELPRMIVMPFRSRLFDDYDLPQTVVHEAAHEWFYATLATNEFDEPWLDEGFACYYTDRIMSEFYPENNTIKFNGLQVDTKTMHAGKSHLSEYMSPLSAASDDVYPGTYYYSSYGRAPSVLRTLEGVLGTEVFDKAMRDFASAYKFKHPHTDDLQNSFESATDQDLSWFFDSYVYGTAKVDYEVYSLRSSREAEDSLYNTTVEIRRNYESILPQTLIVRFRDGTEQSALWDGVDRYHKAEFESASPVSWAAIDTSYYYLIDENFANNSLKQSPENAKLIAFSSLVMMMTQLLLSFTGLL